MTERGIIFSGDNPKLIQDGLKTHTRRLVKPQPIDDRMWIGGAVIVRPNGNKIGVGSFDSYKPEELREFCPYGVAGDRLYVKETHWRYGRWVKNGNTKIGRQKWKFLVHRSSPISFVEPTPLTHEKRINPKRGSGEGWYKRPSIFLPKKLARTWLEILRVRVERLQDISTDDCQAEGVQFEWSDDQGETPGRYLFFTSADTKGKGHTKAKDAYHYLWDSLHGKGEWDKNPFVWVIEFCKV